jgi:hypothetical protein
MHERLVEARKLYMASVAALDRVQQGKAANDRIETARTMYLKARSELLEHEGEHGCGFR